MSTRRRSRVPAGRRPGKARSHGLFAAMDQDFLEVAHPRHAAKLVQQVFFRKLGLLPGHAGHFETAAMMALRPELVHHEALPIAMERQMEGSMWPGGSFGTVTPPFNSLGASGTSDDASRATPEWGERLLAIAVREVATAIASFHETAGTWFAA